MTAKSTVLAQLVRVVASEGSDQPLPLRLSRAAAAILDGVHPAPVRAAAA